MFIITILKWAWNNIQFVLIAALIIFIAVLSHSCTENAAKVKTLTNDVKVLKDSLILKEYQLKVVTQDRDSCRSEQKQVIKKAKQAEVDNIKKTKAFRENISKLTPTEKQRKLLELADKIVNSPVVSKTIILTNDSLTTPLGTIKLGDKEFPYYTEQQQNLLLWAVGEGKILQDDKELTKKAESTYDVLIESVGKRIISSIDTELKSKHFLGIGQKRSLKELRKELLVLFTQYNIKT